MKRAVGPAVPPAVGARPNRGLAAVCERIGWAVDGTIAPTDLLAWLDIVQRDDGPVMNDRASRRLVDDARNLLQLHLVAALNEAQCRDNLTRLVERVCRD